MAAEPPRTPASRTAIILAALAATIAGVTFLLGPVAAAIDHVREGFPGYYTAARLVVEGRWSPRVYDDAWFAGETLAVSDGRIGEIFRPNPPVAALVVLPLAGLDLTAARRAWLVLEIAVTIAVWLLLVAAIPGLRAPPLALGLLALVLAWTPLREDVSMGQVYVPLLAIHLAALLGLATARRIAGGVALGAAATTKLAAIPWLFALLVRREWRVLLVAAAAAAALAIATLPFAGLDGWAAFVTGAWRDATADRPSLASTAYQSTTGLLRHLLAPDATWNAGAVANLPLLARGLGLAVSAWVVAVTVLVARRSRPELVAAFAVTSGVLALNVAQEYTFTLLILPAGVAISRSVSAAPGRVGATAWLAIAIALLAAPLPYRDPAFDHGWVALLAYPRVYGAWLLWGWLAREIKLEASEDQRDRQRATAETR
jgi:hypothetical protein